MSIYFPSLFESIPFSWKNRNFSLFRRKRLFLFFSIFILLTSFHVYLLKITRIEERVEIDKNLLGLPNSAWVVSSNFSLVFAKHGYFVAKHCFFRARLTNIVLEKTKPRKAFRDKKKIAEFPSLETVAI